ncbi:MAG: hypothetical protein ABSA62_06125 [Methyloceanibacter sp.]
MVEGTDGTADILRQLSKAKDAPTFTIIEPAKRRGLSAAFKLGFAAALEGADQSKLYLVESGHSYLGLLARHLRPPNRR